MSGSAEADAIGSCLWMSAQSAAFNSVGRSVPGPAKTADEKMQQRQKTRHVKKCIDKSPSIESARPAARGSRSTLVPPRPNKTHGIQIGNGRRLDFAISKQYDPGTVRHLAGR